MVKKIILLVLIGIIVFLAGFLVGKLEVGKPEIREPEVGKPEKDIVVTKTATLPIGRYDLACAENSATHKIYCFGGRAEVFDSEDVLFPFDEIIEYDPATDTLITKTATLPTKRHWLACAENSATNKIYCFGGGGGGKGSLNQVIEYDPATDTLITKKATLPTGRENLACAENSATHKIYCFGGNDGSNYFNEIVEYDPAEDTLIIKTATLPTGRDMLACAENSATHKIYCFGGLGESLNRLDEIVEYDPAEDTLTTKTATLPTRRYDLACAENSATHKIYCFGGRGRYYLDEIVEYNPAKDTLTAKTAILPTGRTGLACAENSATHKIYCFGGLDENYRLLDEIVEYDPARDR